MQHDNINTAEDKSGCNWKQQERELIINLSDLPFQQMP
jgi:hypothetical protein